MRRVFSGSDTLAVMPTGSGKSLCYQLPAMLRPTPTLVVSPLIALMKDQVDHAPEAFRDQVTFINSSLSPDEAGARLRALSEGRLKLLYAAPERLRQQRFVQALQSAGVGLVVVDEAHCVALWGHDFRPDYLFIRSALEGVLRGASVLAMTATATPSTASEICAALGRDMHTVRFSVVRGNLRYAVERLPDEERKLRWLVDHVPSWEGPGIVYVRARERCERVAALLRRQGVHAVHYHALVDREARAAAQDGFVRNDIRVVVATTAFGMGVDKPDVRWVVLYNYPTSVEEYVQQVGRAGRDGAPSTCVLLSTSGDAGSLRAFARRDTATVDELRRVWTQLRAAGSRGAVEVAAEELAQAAALPDGKDPRVHCGVLERAGLIQRHLDAGRAMRFSLLPPPADAGERVARLVERVSAAAMQRVDGIVGFAERWECRHAQVARHFADAFQAPCGRCDVCDAPAGVHPRAVSTSRAASSTGWRGDQGTRAMREPPPDPAATIVAAVQSLPIALGVRGLVATLTGSVAAPPSAQRHATYGAMEALAAGTVERWVRELIHGGYLVRRENDSGFPVLAVGDAGPLPQWDAAAGHRGARRGGSQRRTGAEAHGSGPTTGEEERFAALRRWRTEEARKASVPPYIILPDTALREIARRAPATEADLAGVPGMGAKRLAAWGAAVVRVVGEGDQAGRGPEAGTGRGPEAGTGRGPEAGGGAGAGGGGGDGAGVGDS